MTPCSVSLRFFCLLFMVTAFCRAQIPSGPSDAKAQQTFAEAQQLEAKHQYTFALDNYRKADKQDGNHCAACAQKVVSLGLSLQEFKAADAAAQELVASAKAPAEQAAAHVTRARVLLAMGKEKKKPDCFTEGQKETDAALAVESGNGSALFL